MNQTATADIIIVGGGIAGLWLLNRVRTEGFTALLLESNTLGGGQTTRSQGIIHGGMKYALTGTLNPEVQALSDMPSVWGACLQGKGELDLSAVPILSTHQYLWSPQKFAAKLTGFLAGAALSSKVDSVPKNNYPALFQHPAFKGELFALNELVLDVPVLIEVLAKANEDAIYKIDAMKFEGKDKLISMTVNVGEKNLTLTAQHFVFTAGSGNALIIDHLKNETVKMQTRPLHMVLVQTPFDYPVYAHCMGLGARPRITITTHYRKNGKAVWYFGGQLAEEGVERTPEEQIQAARKELHNLFPWLDFSEALFATFMIDRAEPQQRSFLKPESSFAKTMSNITIAWPTKLALAPKLASEIMQEIAQLKLTPQTSDLSALKDWPKPKVAAPLWEELFCKSAN